MQQPLNSELILSKEQLYDMFQQILGVKKFEHQLLFNALMVNVFSNANGFTHIYMIYIYYYILLYALIIDNMYHP